MDKRIEIVAGVPLGFGILLIASVVTKLLSVKPFEDLLPNVRPVGGATKIIITLNIYIQNYEKNKRYDALCTIFTPILLKSISRRKGCCAASGAYTEMKHVSTNAPSWMAY